jgi:ABC-2 type transport system permease protein
MIATMAARCARLTSRQTDSLITSLTLPVMLMVTFVYLFGGAINTGTKYVTYVVPGVLVLCAVVGSAATAVTVCQDMTGGIIDRFRSMDVGPVPVLAGHVAASVVRNVVSWVLALGIALGIGFRPHASVTAWLAAAGVLLAFVVAVSWLAAAFGLLISSPEAANGATFGFMFICYASSAFVPVRTMPW